MSNPDSLSLFSAKSEMTPHTSWFLTPTCMFVAFGLTKHLFVVYWFLYHPPQLVRWCFLTSIILRNRWSSLWHELPHFLGQKLWAIVTNKHLRNAMSKVPFNVWITWLEVVPKFNGFYITEEIIHHGEICCSFQLEEVCHYFLPRIVWIFSHDHEAGFSWHILDTYWSCSESEQRYQATILLPWLSDSTSQCPDGLDAILLAPLSNHCYRVAHKQIHPSRRYLSSFQNYTTFAKERSPGIYSVTFSSAFCCRLKKP